MQMMCNFTQYIYGESLKTIALPRLPEWDKTTYPDLFIQYGNAEGMECYNLIASTNQGTVTDGILNIASHTYCAWTVAANETAVSNLQGAFPGISTTAWLSIETAQSKTNAAYDSLWWANYDLTTADGTIYLKSTKPTWTKLTDFQCGLAAGLSSKTRIPKKKTPIAYLYNGVQLPPLPEWDRERYPFAVIWALGGTSPNAAGLHAFAEPRHLTLQNNESKVCIGVEPGCKYLASVMAIMSDEFPTMEEKTNESTYNLLITDEPIWANYDVLNADGTIYLVASEPVPVYE